MQQDIDEFIREQNCSIAKAIAVFIVAVTLAILFGSIVLINL